jgi:hypothetical protein
MNDWFPADTNTAGDFPLSTDGALVCGKALRGQTLLWTTVDLWTMNYIGGELIYSFTRAGDNCGIVSHHGFACIDTAAYWMGNTKQFFTFDGFVKPIACEVTDYVFGDFNSTYAYKVWTLANPRFGEVTWFYPSAAATECDRYVTYNYLENHWTFGSMSRATGVPLSHGATTLVPVMITSAGSIYDHETGNTRTGSTAYLESGPIMLGDGDNVMRIQRIVPDDETQGDVTASLYTSMYPNDSETENGPYSLLSPTSVRLTARQVRLKLTEAVASNWRVGVVKLGAIVGGRR